MKQDNGHMGGSFIYSTVACFIMCTLFYLSKSFFFVLLILCPKFNVCINLTVQMMSIDAHIVQPITSLLTCAFKNCSDQQSCGTFQLISTLSATSCFLFGLCSHIEETCLCLLYDKSESRPMTPLYEARQHWEAWKGAKRCYRSGQREPSRGLIHCRCRDFNSGGSIMFRQNRQKKINSAVCANVWPSEGEKSPVFPNRCTLAAPALHRLHIQLRRHANI